MTNLERPIGWCTHWFILKFLIKENMSIDLKMYKEYKTGKKMTVTLPYSSHSTTYKNAKLIIYCIIVLINHRASKYISVCKQENIKTKKSE